MANGDKGWSYTHVFETIISTQNAPGHIVAMATAIKNDGINKTALNKILGHLGNPNISFYKNDILDLMIMYLNIILEDHHISEIEYREFGLLKILFKIEEGDFYKRKYHQVKSIIDDHLTYIFEDGEVSIEEALQTVDLESMFGLSNDQYEEFEKHFKDKFVQAAIPLPTSRTSTPSIQRIALRKSGPFTSKSSIESKLSYTYQKPVLPSKKNSDNSKIWGLILFIILGLLVAWLKKAMRH